MHVIFKSLSAYIRWGISLRGNSPYLFELIETNFSISDELEYKRRKSQEWRAEQTPEQREQTRELAKIRQRRYYARKKVEINEKSRIKSSIILTRKEREKRRDKWRESKRKYRNSLSRQRKIEINMQRSKRKSKIDMVSEEESENEDILEACYNTEGAFYKAVRKAKRSLPETPEKYAACLKGLLNTTPRKKRKLTDAGLTESASTKKKKSAALKLYDNIKEELTNSTDTKERTLARRRVLYGLMSKSDSKSTVARELGANWTYFCRASAIEEESKDYSGYRRARCDKLSAEVVASVEEFYNKHENSIPLPNKSSKKKRVLDQSLQSLHSKFLAEHPHQISYSTFCKLRPQSVKTMSARFFRQCLCEYCTNVELKLKSLNNKTETYGLAHLNKYDASRITLCEKGANLFYKRRCVSRQCKECGVSNIEDYYNQILQENDQNEVTEYMVWETHSFLHKGKTCRRKKITIKSCTIRQLIALVKLELEQFSEHLHIARFQYNAFDKLLDDLPDKTAVMCIDFAENYNCNSQNEVAGAHWSQEQVTVFPACTYYICPDCNALCKDVCIIISNDLKHDTDAAHAFIKKVNEHLETRLGKNLKREVIFSDGAPTHFKNKNSVAKLPKMRTQFANPPEIEWSYFGPRHGKNPCDGEGGVVKNACSQAVKNGKVIIQSAGDMFSFCEQNLVKEEKCSGTSHSTRRFFYVNVNRKHKPKTGIQPIPGIRKLFNIRVKDQQLETRNLSCYCQECNSSAPCLTPWVDTWKSPTQYPTECVEGTQGNPSSDSDGETIESASENEAEDRREVGSSRSDVQEKATVIENTTVEVDYSEFCEEESKKGVHKKLEEIKRKRKRKSKCQFKIKPKIKRQLKKILKTSPITTPPPYERYYEILSVLTDQQRLDYVREDGNCFFRSLSKCITGTEVYYSDYREMVVLLMRDNEEAFARYVDGDYEAHLAKMRKNRTWATTSEVFAAAALLQRSIYVLTPSQLQEEGNNPYYWLLFQPQLKNIELTSSCNCFISIVNTGGLHYDRITTESGSCNCGTVAPQLQGMETHVDITDSESDACDSTEEVITVKDNIRA